MSDIDDFTSNLTMDIKPDKLSKLKKLKKPFDNKTDKLKKKKKLKVLFFCCLPKGDHSTVVYPFVGQDFTY